MGYRYLAYDDQGNPSRGMLDVETESAAERALWERNLTIVELAPARPPIDFQRMFPTFLGPKRQDLVIFSQQLANLVESGVGLVPALELLAAEVASAPLRKVLEEVLEEVQQGTPMSRAMAEHELVFPEMYCRMVEVGERTGNIGFVLRELAGYLESEMEVSRKVRDAVSYPAFLLLFAIGVVILILNFTLPAMLGLYSEFNAQLPLPTRILISAASFFVSYRIHLFAALAILVIAGFIYFTRPRGRRQLDALLLKIPVIGTVLLHGEVSRIGRTLATLLQAGVSLPEALQLTGSIVTNRVISSAMETLRRESLQGRGLSEPIARTGLFPRMLSQMVRVGEETGTLDANLKTLAGFYDEEVDRSIKRVTGLLEPGLIIFVGLIVGFVAISVIMPMYSLLQNIK
ncbi:MAG: type II secretion system F family protein [Anaerolineales bacterium]|jgi:type IV pilus assembly protein PilC